MGCVGDVHNSQFLPAPVVHALQELSRLGVDVVTVPRGGETTYHGPGQLVAYPIVNLRQLGLGARAFVEGLEDAMVQTVGCFGIQVWQDLQGVGVCWGWGGAEQHAVVCGQPARLTARLLGARPGQQLQGCRQQDSLNALDTTCDARLQPPHQAACGKVWPQIPQARTHSICDPMCWVCASPAAASLACRPEAGCPARPAFGSGSAR